MAKWAWTVVAALIVLMGVAAEETLAEETLAEERPMVCPSGQECFPLFFEPTNVFQVVRPGQVLPTGLHTRIDSQTGVFEARLADPGEETPDASLAAIVTDDTTSHSEPERMSPERYAELKGAFEVLMEAASQESREMTRIANALRDYGNLSDTELVNLLERLENIVHLIDNGRDLIRLDATSILKQLFAFSSPSVRQKAALVLGGAMQNNPEVQNHLLEVDNLLPLLIERIEQDANDYQSQCRDLFVLSCLLRGRDDSLELLVQTRGLSTLLIQMAGPSGTCAFNKIIDFLSSQYAATLDTSVKTAVGNVLRSFAWCESLASRLVTPDLVVIDNVARAITATAPLCGADVVPRLPALINAAYLYAMALAAGSTDCHAAMVETMLEEAANALAAAA